MANEINRKVVFYDDNNFKIDTNQSSEKSDELANKSNYSTNGIYFTPAEPSDENTDKQHHIAHDGHIYTLGPGVTSKKSETKIELATVTNKTTDAAFDVLSDNCSNLTIVTELGASLIDRFNKNIQYTTTQISLKPLIDKINALADVIKKIQYSDDDKYKLKNPVVVFYRTNSPSTKLNKNIFVVGEEYKVYLATPDTTTKSDLYSNFSINKFTNGSSTDTIQQAITGEGNSNELNVTFISDTIKIINYNYLTGKSNKETLNYTENVTVSYVPIYYQLYCNKTKLTSNTNTITNHKLSLTDSYGKLLSDDLWNTVESLKNTNLGDDLISKYYNINTNKKYCVKGSTITELTVSTNNNNNPISTITNVSNNANTKSSITVGLDATIKAYKVFVTVNYGSTKTIIIDNVNPSQKIGTVVSDNTEYTSLINSISAQYKTDTPNYTNHNAETLVSALNAKSSTTPHIKTVTISFQKIETNDVFVYYKENDQIVIKNIKDLPSLKVTQQDTYKNNGNSIKIYNAGEVKVGSSWNNYVKYNFADDTTAGNTVPPVQAIMMLEPFNLYITNDGSTVSKKPDSSFEYKYAKDDKKYYGYPRVGSTFIFEYIK